MNDKTKFWETKSLNKMNDNEWESLCDGCGRCCLVKLQDEDSDRVYLTNVACKLFDLETGRCSDYTNRLNVVPMCMNLKTDLLAMVNYLPEFCAYRLLHEGKPLEGWHPLLSKISDSTQDAGVSICEFAVSESAVHPDQIQEHIIESIGNDH